jgi:hypothetical protein
LIYLSPKTPLVRISDVPGTLLAWSILCPCPFAASSNAIYIQDEIVWSAPRAASDSLITLGVLIPKRKNVMLRMDEVDFIASKISSTQCECVF